MRLGVVVVTHSFEHTASKRLWQRRRECSDGALRAAHNERRGHRMPPLA
jgi:hypothetical protein